MRAFFITVLCLLLLLCSLPSHPAHAQTPPLVVIYIDGSALYGWQEGVSGGSPRVLATSTGMITRPILSLDATKAIFQTDETVKVIDLSSSTAQPRDLLTPEILLRGAEKSEADKPRRVLDMAWLDNDTLIFNSYRFNPKQFPQQQIENNLWRVSVSSGKVEPLLENGQGGAFSISPDGKWIAVVRPGDFASKTPGVIALVESKGGSPRKLLDFPFVNTGSSSPFYPALQWNLDSSAIFAALPDPDLVYATENVPATALWRLGIDGSTQQTGGVYADFFALPSFSPDGKTVLYARRIGALKDNRLALVRANSDGTNETQIALDSIGNVQPAQWLPDGTYWYGRGKPGELWLGPLRFPNEREVVFYPAWVDPTTAIYATVPGGPGELRLATINAAPRTIAALKQGGQFDAHRKR